MNAQRLQEACSMLPSFEEYESSSQELIAATRAKPHGVNAQSNATDLRAQITFLEAQEAYHEPLRQHMTEIATASHISLPYRLGMLAALKVQPRPKPSLVDIMSDLRYLPHFSDDVTMEQDWHHPPHDPYKHATLIGNRIAELKKRLTNHRSLPIARLYVGRMRDNHSHPTEADYFLVNPKNAEIPGFSVVEPEVMDKGVKFVIPHINARKAVIDRRTFRIKPLSEDVWRAQDYLEDPVLEQLTSRHASPAKLLIGKRAVLAFARKKSAEDAEYARKRRDFAIWQQTARF